jgi:hypothetical protein
VTPVFPVAIWSPYPAALQIRNQAPLLKNIDEAAVFTPVFRAVVFELARLSAIVSLTRFHSLAIDF